MSGVGQRSPEWCRVRSPESCRSPEGPVLRRWSRPNEEVGVAFLEVHMVQVREIIRRWQAGESKMALGRASAVSARTGGRYIEAATAAGLKQDGEPPGEEVLAQLLRRNHPAHTCDRLVGGACPRAGDEGRTWVRNPPI